MKSCIYCMYDEIAKQTVSIFQANNDEQATVNIENTLKRSPLARYKVSLYKLVEFDVTKMDTTSVIRDFRFVKTFKGGKK